jgi:predicted transcriptional regulator
MEKVKKELQRMENMGVISRVDKPTNWCSGMVVVPKSDGSVSHLNFPRTCNCF